MVKYRGYFLWAIAGLLMAWVVAGYVPSPSQATPQPLPALEARLEYTDYFVIDAGSGNVLDRLTARSISVGDEYVAENNRRYIINKVDGKFAYAEFLGAADIGENIRPKINKHR